jgi:hypothetical protein
LSRCRFSFFDLHDLFNFAGQKPALWPFHIVLSIDGGELRSLSSYGSLVRDRDLLEAELLVLPAEVSESTGTGMGAKTAIPIPIEDYVGVEVATKAAEAAGIAAKAATAVTAQPTPAAVVMEQDEQKGNPAIPLSRTGNGAAHATALPRSHSSSASSSRADGRSSGGGGAVTTTAVAASPAVNTSSTTTTTTAAKPAPGQYLDGSVQRKNTLQFAHLLPCARLALLCCVPAAISCDNCGQSATLGPCPYCVKNGRLGVFFCTQVSSRKK